MKKTIWQPVVLGSAMGMLAGLSTITGLSINVPGTEDLIGYTNTIGIFNILLLLAAALGGPLAGATASTLFFTIAVVFGPPEIKAVFDNIEVFWANLIVVGTLMVLVGIAYRIIYERTEIPALLLLWSTIVIVFYIILLPTNITLQNYMLGDGVDLPAILFGYKTYISQAIFDLFFTSLVFIALPKRFRRPFWYTPKQSLKQNGAVQNV